MTTIDRSAAPAPARTARPLPAPVGVDQAPAPLRTRLERAKFAYSTRTVPAHLRRAEQLRLLTGDHTPQAGQVVLARVDEIGQHKRIESPASRRRTLFPGDEIVVAYGSRYAADQFLAVLPTDLRPCHLAAAGGLASLVVDRHAAIDEPTAITPIGVLADEHGPISLERTSAHRVLPGIGERAGRPGHRVPVIAVLGTSMNSGKTTLLAQLAHGLVAAGLEVAAGKATGTGAGNDHGLFVDAGAQRVLDFTDFGHPSTFRLDAASTRDLFLSMVDELAGGARRPDVVLVEIADGLFQGETAELLRHPAFTEVVDTVAFAASDALGAVGGVAALQDLGHVPTLVSGLLTASPLATAEARRAIEVPVVPTLDLGRPEIALPLVAELLAEGEREEAGRAS